MKGSNKATEILQESPVPKWAIEHRRIEATSYVVSKTDGSIKGIEELIGDGERVLGSVNLPLSASHLRNGEDLQLPAFNHIRHQ
jgi:hypothetical protein